MLPSCFEDEPQLLSHWTRAEEEDHDQRVWEADLGAVDGAIADGFEEDEGLLVRRIEEDFAFNITLLTRSVFG